ncbi:cytochrome P450 [Coprinopsis marcescibilis]|uniref:Cytochrome P450 n=1 Tax=Coprinopsis marcescibilis TaxID=230819 RepID=A0A5C3KRE9_COPMA|nr:cytochrome P450 [Coprinopsis marcescibilis]
MWSSALHFVLPVFSVAWALLKLCESLRRRLANSDKAIENLPGPPPLSFWRGNFDQIFDDNAWDFHKDIALTYGNVIRVRGPLGTNQLFVFDPKAMQHLVVKDQHIYEEATHFVAGNNVIFGAGLLSTLGDHHRRQRKMLNPVFSIAHMKGMVPLFYSVTSKLRDTLALKVSSRPTEIEMHAWLSRTALELIGQSGLGYSFDSLTDDGHQHPYSSSVKALSGTFVELLFARHYFFPLVYKIGSRRFQRFVVDMLPWRSLHDLRDIVDCLHKTSSEIFEAKKKALYQGTEDKEVGGGKDIISVLMSANMNASEADRLPDSEVIGQMSTLTFAAMDTTSSALSRILWLLSKHPHVQEKLRQEICQVHAEHGDLGYDDLVALPYLDAVCRETLRLLVLHLSFRFKLNFSLIRYPPIATLTREARHECILPLSKPVRGLDGQEMTEVLVPKNTKIYLSVISSNRNPDLWGPDSFEWKPERWLSPLPESLNEAKIPGVYSNLMTFLGGGRACIGFKFSQLEMKVVLCVLLQSFRFSLPRDKNIFWKMTGISKPGVEGEQICGTDPAQPKLPLVVSVLDAGRL